MIKKSHTYSYIYIFKNLPIIKEQTDRWNYAVFISPFIIDTYTVINSLYWFVYNSFFFFYFNFLQKKKYIFFCDIKKKQKVSKLLLIIVPIQSNNNVNYLFFASDVVIRRFKIFFSCIGYVSVMWIKGPINHLLFFCEVFNGNMRKLYYRVMMKMQKKKNKN